MRFNGIDFGPSKQFRSSFARKQNIKINAMVTFLFIRKLHYFHEYCTCTNEKVFYLTFKTISKYNDLQTNVKTN